MSTRDDDPLVRDVAAAARAEHARDRALDEATRAGDTEAVQRLLGIDPEAAAEIVASARAAHGVTTPQLWSRLPAPRTRQLFGALRVWAPAMAALAVVGLWWRGAGPEAPVGSTTPMVVARYVPGAGGAHDRRQHLVRLEVSAECALDAIVHVTRWEGTGPAPDPLEPAHTLRLVWDDDAKRRGFVEVYADEARGASFIVETRCTPTRPELLRALRGGDVPWVAVRALVVPRVRTGTGS